MRPVLALAAAFLAACTAGPAPVSAPAEQNGAATGGAPPLVVSFQIEPTPDSVAFLLQVTNATQAPLTLAFSSGQSYDFAVADAGRTAWRWSDGRMFTQALRSETLAPGQTRTFRELWRPDPALRGKTLTATARLVSTSHPAARTQTFRLP